MRKYYGALAFAFVLLLTPAALAQPLTTSFTVQGEIAQSGVPAAGPVDLRFRLYDSLAGPGQIGSPLAAAGVALSGGRFTVSLDFGPAAFAGQRRWLEIDVSPAGMGTYTTLAPRQELTVAPNATFALSAGQASSASNAALLNGQPATFYQNAANLTSGTIPDARLAATVARTNTAQTFSGAMTFSNVSNAFTGTHTGSGAGLTSLNASNISSGALADARLSTNVALLSGVQTFTGGKTFSSPPAFTAAGAPFTVSNTSRVANLNADLLDGLDSANFLRAGNPIDLAATAIGSSVIRATNFDTTTLDSSAIRGNVFATTGVNAVGVIGYKGPSGASHTMIGGGAGVVGYADSGFGVAGVLFGTGVGTGVYGYAGSDNAFAGQFQGRVGVNGTLDVNLPSKSVQFRMDGGLVPGINLTGTGGNLGILRFRNSLEIWPNDAGTAPGRLDVRDTSGAARVILDGSNGNVVASGSFDVDEWGQNDGTFGAGVVRLGGSGSGEGIASNRTSDANGNRYGIDFYTGGGARRMSITVDGKVGIGTNTPLGLLQVGDQTSGSGGDVIIPGPATAAIPYTSSTDLPRQSFLATADCAVLSIDVLVSNNGSARSTALGLVGPGVNVVSNLVSMPPSTNPIVLTYTFNSPPQIIAGQTYTWSWVGGPIDGLSRAWYRSDNPYANGQGAGPSLPANSDFVCTVHTSAVGTGTQPGLIVTTDRRVGIGTATPTQTLTVAGNAIFTGTISKGGGSFQIDHPLDPANKFLFHSFVESPDMMNIYNGNVVTDADGYATITLPDWFSALNRDYRYQLTVIDEDDDADVFLWAKVVRKVGAQAPNQFTLRSARGNLEVSWQVTGIRKDAFAEKNRIPVEVEKGAADKGKYLHPEAFGLPSDKGVYAGRSEGATPSERADATPQPEPR